ncbi:YceI family protein [Actinoallomurus sp. NPDC050550]|uniref:YceI family protein n=1 Tax=Actinoallomurus sp. NPDC050550 TaxID=3154937 RepID=UPI0034117008
MTYRSTGIHVEGGDFVLDGELTLKDVTQSVPLTLQVHGFGPDYFLPDPQSGARAGFTATGEVSRLAFGVGDNSPLPGGGIGLSDKVQITLEIEAVLQK